MNTSYTLSQPSNPHEGDTFYDMNIRSTKMYVDGDWHTIGGTDIDVQNYFWLTDTKLPYAKILNGNWLIMNLKDIKQWLNDNNAGEYIPALSAIVFNNQQHATFFELKWG